jgi:putative MATE family efflux protein
LRRAARRPESLIVNAPQKPPNPLLAGPVLPIVVRLATPNVLAMTAATGISIAETVYVGALGTSALAGLALVFPMVMLLNTMSAGAMGGGVASSIARALGAGDEARAQSLVMHSVAIAVIAGLAFTFVFLLFGEWMYRLLGGTGAPLAEAVAYSNVVFSGAIAMWLTNTLAAAVRGMGNMRIPALAMLGTAVLQIIFGGGLGLGIGPFPKMGMAGVALGQVLANVIGTAFMVWMLTSGRTRVGLVWRGFVLRRDMFRDILKVGAIALISPVQTIATVLVLTRLMAYFGEQALAGYGIGARLEFLLIPITFAFGGACVPLVGMAIGAKNVSRAYRVAWTGGLLSAALVGVIGLIVAIAPWLWSNMFSADESVRAAADLYLRIAGPAFAFFGLGHGLYFASQGSGKILGPVMAGTLRFAIIAIGGWLLAVNNAPAWMMFALVAIAMVAYGLSCALSVYMSKWGPKT